MLRLTGFPPVAIRGPRKLPLIGTAVQLARFFSDPVGGLLALNREFGPIATVVDRNPALVCVFGGELNREVLSKPALFHNLEEVFRAAPGTSHERIKYQMVLLNGEMHARHRRLMMPAFRKSYLRAHAADIVAIADSMLNRWPLGECVDLAQLLRNLTLAVGVRCLFGLEVGDGGPELGELAEALQDDISSPLGMLIRYPIPGTPFHRSLETSAQLVRRMQALIDDKRRRPPSDDVLSLMIHAHDEDGSSFTDDELMGEATGLFIAGHETTAKTLVWTLFLLEQHPEVLAGAVDEIEAVLRGAPPTFGDLDELPSVDRIVKEGMRLLAVSALLFPRSCAEGVPLGSHRLPKGANVLVSPLITHRDAAVFPSPMRFLPERWNDLKPSIYEYLPFGGGARMCLGAPLGALIVRLLLTMILQRYRLSLAEGAVVSRQVRGNVLWPKHGLPVRLAKQDRALARPRPVRGDIHELVALPQR